MLLIFSMLTGNGLGLGALALGQDRLVRSPFPPPSDAVLPDSAGTTPGHAPIPRAQPPVRIRLNYLTASWETVLGDVADAMGLHLVATEFPPGRFSRQDLSWHDAERALSILNRELDKSGFTLHVQQNYLLLSKSRGPRVEYLRPDQLEAEVMQAGGVRTPEEYYRPGYTRQFDSVLPHSGQPGSSSRTIRDPLVRTVSHENEPHHVTHHEQAAPVSMTYHARSRTALDLARALYDTYRSRAELVDNGPTGLPAFQVLELTSDATGRAPTPAGVHPFLGEQRHVWLTIEIDNAKNQLQLHGHERTLTGLQRLLQVIDRPQAPGEAPPRLVADRGGMGRIGEELAPQLNRLRQRRGNVPAQGTLPNPNGFDPFSPTPLLAFQDQGGAGTGQQPPPPPVVPPGLFDAEGLPPGASPQEMLDLIQNLRGDVNIEIIDDLNLMIIYGNEADIESVLRLIRAIDAMAIGASPEIRLHFLQYVNSEALASLLNEVYSGLGNVRQQTGQVQPTVTVIPVVTPNAILILAPGAAIEFVVDLAQELDQQGDPQTEVQVFPLKNAVVSQVLNMLETFYADRGGLAPRIRAIADIRTNTLILQARPRDLEEVTQLIRRVDRDESPAVSQVRVIRLQNALADEVAEFLTNALQGILSPAATTGAVTGFVGGAGQAPQELRDSKAIVLEFLTRDGTVEKLVRSGLLSDIRVTADIRTNSLYVTAPPASLPLMEELVKTLDLPSAAVADIKVFQLKNADASAAVDLLTALFVTDQQAQNQLAFQLPGSTDASSSLIPLRFSLDARTNSVVALGGSDAMRVVEAILIRLDTNELRQREMRILKLRNSPATDVATAINQFLANRRALAQLDPDRFSISELLNQEIIVTPEPITNSLIIEATPRYYNEILSMALELDAEPPQVMIQALIVEVILDDTDEFGVELGFQDPLLFQRSVLDAPVTITETTTLPTGVQTTTQRIISQTGQPGFLFNNQQLGNNVNTHPSSVGTQGLSNFALGRVNGDLGFGGLVLAASSDAVNVLVRALSAHRNVRILSRPQVSVLDGQLAQIQVGQVVPVVNGVTFNQNQTIPIVEQQDAGIILTVQPRISPEGQVVMVVAAEKSQFQTAGVPLFTDLATGNVITSPIKDVTTASTTIKVPNGQTVVLGGMITQSDDVFERKVPWLGDIPLIGHAFRYDAVTHLRTELLIFLTPRVINNCHDSELIKQVETDRMHFFLDDAERIHGPIFSAPPSEFFPEGQVIDGFSPWSSGPSFHSTPAPAPLPMQNYNYEAVEPFNVPTTIMPRETIDFSPQGFSPGQFDPPPAP